jgi:hypothetical protein
MVQKEFSKAGITQAALAARMQKDPAQLNRLLNAPGNWTLDTVSDLLFAISGGVPAYSVAYPLDKPVRNDTRPRWASDSALLLAGLSASETGTTSNNVLFKDGTNIGASEARSSL